MSPATPEPPAGKAPAAGGGTVLAFDFGEKRIGVAVGETEVRQAHPLLTIAAVTRADRFARIGALIAEWRPALLVVGRPLSLAGEAHELTARCERFANQLRGRFKLPVDFADERLSSADAEMRLREIGHSGRQARDDIDAVAALVILEGYFDAKPR